MGPVPQFHMTLKGSISILDHFPIKWKFAVFFSQKWGLPHLGASKNDPPGVFWCQNVSGVQVVEWLLDTHSTATLRPFLSKHPYTLFWNWKCWKGGLWVQNVNSDAQRCDWYASNGLIDTYLCALSSVVLVIEKQLLLIPCFSYRMDVWKHISNIHSIRYFWRWPKLGFLAKKGLLAGEISVSRGRVWGFLGDIFWKRGVSGCQKCKNDPCKVICAMSCRIYLRNLSKTCQNGSKPAKNAIFRTPRAGEVPKNIK